MNADKLLFRCSSLGHIMVEPREKAAKERGDLSETTKTHLIDKFVSFKYGRETDIQNRYIKKGLAVEEDSITLYSRVKKVFLKKNDKQLYNNYIIGTPDTFIGEKVEQAEIIKEIKSSWDIFTFHRARCKPTDKDYYWQTQGYMALTGAEHADLIYCLVNTPEEMINSEKRKLLFNMGVTEFDKLYIEACAELDKSMTYDDIPMEERTFEVRINRNDEDIDKLYQKIRKCREYMNMTFFNNTL